jgi:hypothetical protein
MDAAGPAAAEMGRIYVPSGEGNDSVGQWVNIWVDWGLGCMWVGWAGMWAG